MCCLPKRDNEIPSKGKSVLLNIGGTVENSSYQHIILPDERDTVCILTRMLDVRAIFWFDKACIFCRSVFSLVGGHVVSCF